MTRRIQFLRYEVSKGDTLSFAYQARYEAPVDPDYSNIYEYGGSVWMESAADLNCWWEEYEGGWYATNGPGDLCDLILKYEEKKYDLKIVDHAPWSIWPALLPCGVTRNEMKSLAGYKPERGFTISVTDGSGKPVNGAAVEIVHNYQQGTGGMFTEEVAMLYLPKACREYSTARAEAVHLFN